MTEWINANTAVMRLLPFVDEARARAKLVELMASGARAYTLRQSQHIRGLTGQITGRDERLTTEESEVRAAYWLPGHARDGASSHAANVGRPGWRADWQVLEFVRVDVLNKHPDASGAYYCEHTLTGLSLDVAAVDQLVAVYTASSGERQQVGQTTASLPDVASFDEIRAFVSAFPGRDSKKAWNAFQAGLRERAKGTYPSFMDEWKSTHQRGRGRPTEIPPLSEN